MRWKKNLLRSLFVLGIIFIALFTWLYLKAFPVISGYGAKNLCSALYLQHRDPAAVIKEDLGEFPLSLGTFRWNKTDSSVTGSVFGLAKRKAIYREGMGCTLINGYTEKEVRAQTFMLPTGQCNRDDSLAWPLGEKVEDSLPAHINREALELAVANVMKENTAEGQPAHTRAVIIVYDGKIIAESYAKGFDRNTLMLGWSISKSLTAALIGILVKENKLTVNMPAPVAEWKGTRKEGITVRQLLQQTSGIDYTEIYTRPSSVTRMLFSEGDMGKYAASLPLNYEPGTRFNYSGGNTNIMSRIIRETVGEKEYAGFPYRELFSKINACSFLLEPDASGTYIGSSYSYATARDFARFGLLYYNQGMWNGEQLLPAGWVQESIQPSEGDPQKQYGYQFWLNGFDKENPGKRTYPDVPADMYYADGYGGQDIYIIPSEKLVAVRLGLFTIDENRFLKEVIQSLHK